MEKSKGQQARETLKKYWYVPGLLILMAVLFLAGSWYGKTVADQKTTGGRRILHYVDPMNPAHTSSEPGLAPCGMKMEPVYADEGQMSQRPCLRVRQDHPGKTADHRGAGGRGGKISLDLYP